MVTDVLIQEEIKLKEKAIKQQQIIIKEDGNTKLSDAKGII